MNAILWIVQGLLCAMFLLAGIMKSMQPKEKLTKLVWTSRQTAGKIKFIGISEILIGLGLILPWLTGIIPVLTSIAAVALCLIMILAIVEHAKHKETKEIGLNVFILLLAAFVAWGRLKI
jgi:hypothetical protein